MQKPKLYILVGVPGCGKSTWAKEVLGTYHNEWVSSDVIRQRLFEGEYDSAQNPIVFESFYKQIDEALYEGDNVIADATNLRDHARAKLRAIADVIGADTHLIFFTNVEEALHRNRGREGKIHGTLRVPDGDMEYMLEKYEIAKRDIPLEPYSTVTYVGGFS